MRTNNHDTVKRDALLAALPKALNDIGYDSLRDAQEKCMNTILAGDDTFCVLPTGGGKTLIAVLPAILNKYKAVIFSPLTALMRDQVQSLQRKGLKAGAINSVQPDVENALNLQAWINGELQFLYVSPERIDDKQFTAAMTMVKPQLVVLDEAHCLSQWAPSFRPAYQRVGTFIEQFSPVQVIAMTATATDQIITDVKDVLGTPEMVVEKHYYPRTNLRLEGRDAGTQQQLWKCLVNDIKTREGSIIIYCASVKHVVMLYEHLHGIFGDEVTSFHGQMKPDHLKMINQDRFMSGEARIVVATNAFGMGIDKPDIYTVIHADMPGSLEAVAQETGRAARDGADALCIMYTTDYGEKVQEFLWDMSNPDADTVKFVYNYFKSTADEDGISYVTLKDLTERAGSECVGSSVQFMVSIGLIERLEPSQNALITIKDTLQDPLYDAVLAGGVPVSKDNGHITYKVNLEYIISKLGKSKQHVRSKLNTLAKEGRISYDPPKRSKGSRVLRPLMESDLMIAEARRTLERKKFMMVRQYVTTPDDKKHDMLQNYFGE